MNDLYVDLLRFFRPPKPLSRAAQQAPAPTPTVEPTSAGQPPTPVQVNGFYKATSANTLTFYATTAWPLLTPTQLAPISPGWTVSGMTGVSGNIIVTKAANTPGGVKAEKYIVQPYNWYFEFQTDTVQAITDTHYATGIVLYPPDTTSFFRSSVYNGTITGFYMVDRNMPVFYLTAAAPFNFTKGWTVKGLPTVTGNVTVNSFSTIPGNVVTASIAVPGKRRQLISNSYIAYAFLNTEYPVPNTPNPVYTTATVQAPMKIGIQYGASVSTSNVDQIDQVVTVSQNIMGGNPAPLRDLGDVKDTPSFQEEYKELINTGFNSATTMSLYAIGPQEKYVSGKDDTDWNTYFPQHSNFVMYQRNVPISGNSFLGQTITLEFRPQELGDLLSNMYFKCTLPGLTSTSNAYTNQVGRAIIKQVDFIINDTIVETVYDDWFYIHDQVFLDADEQTAMFSAVNGGSKSNVNSTSTTNVIVPLEFFFCRRYSHANKEHERIRRPYFPLCALWNQKMYIKIQFNPWVWITNDLPVQDIINPSLVFEEIKLTDEERLFYKTTPLRFIVNRVRKESTLSFTSTNPQIQMTASFPVQMITWFIRNKKYEGVQDGRYHDARYNYGYTTNYIQTAVPLNFVSGLVNYIDVIDSAKITLNNVDILSTFQGSLYYSFKQPMEHGLSIPSKSIYMYSFGLNPKEYNQGGYVNFSKLNSQTTRLALQFSQQYSSEITQGYNLYVFYYGYSILEFQGGFARLPFV